MFSDADVFARSSGRRKIWTELFTGKRSCNSTLLHVLLYWKMDHRVADRSSVVSCFFVVETGRKKKETGFWKDAGFRILTTAIAVAGSFCSVVIQTGSVETNKMCFVGLWCIVMLWMVEFAADCSMWLYAGVMGVKNGDSGRLEKIAVILGGVIVLALGLCIIGGGLYVYPQGDDFEYGAYAHQAIEAGYGLQGALGGAAKMVAKSYQIWQGTFSSIFLMALQPGIWGEKYYHLTPLLLIGLLLSALFFFMDSLFRKVCGAKKREVFLLLSLIHI